mmetsp:Transcript_22675/g.52984  ORF Transcript_22675/g.52984 Transcript_22675/m.52984 type:complete len:100 (+) Transcript_22675:57-356(+)
MAAQPCSVAAVLDCVVDREHPVGICGAVCLDWRGLALGSRGDLLPNQTAHIVGIAEGAARLEPDTAHAPVITLETNMRSLSICSRDDLVVAIARKPNEH